MFGLLFFTSLDRPCRVDPCVALPMLLEEVIAGCAEDGVVDGVEGREAPSELP